MHAQGVAFRHPTAILVTHSSSNTRVGITRREKGRTVASSQRHKHVGRRPIAAAAIGLLVVLGILTLPAFAAEDTNDNLADNILDVVKTATEDATGVEADTAETPEEATQAKLAALDNNEVAAFHHYFLSSEEKVWFKLFIMNPEERVQFLDFITPDPPPPAPAPAATSGGSSSVTSSAPAPAASGGGVWDSLAQCESGGNWGTSTGNGFQGGLQFHSQTWSSFGGGEFAASASQASRDGQIAVAERVLNSQGWGAWPGCSAKLGLR